MNGNEISFLVRKSIYNVHNELGPGLLESAYEEKLAAELKNCQLEVKTQVIVPVIYSDNYVDLSLRVNISVENKIIIIVKSVDQICKSDYQFFMICLELSGLKIGFLVNFNTYAIKKNTIRKVRKTKEF